MKETIFFCVVEVDCLTLRFVHCMYAYHFIEAKWLAERTLNLVKQAKHIKYDLRPKKTAYCFETGTFAQQLDLFGKFIMGVLPNTSFQRVNADSTATAYKQQAKNLFGALKASCSP